GEACSTERFQSPYLGASLGASSVKTVRSLLRGVIDYGFRGAKISYSQYGEDLIVRFALENLRIQHPRYIDIGANQPFSGSNTAIFHESGSRGINIETDPYLFESFQRLCTRTINLYFS